MFGKYVPLSNKVNILKLNRELIWTLFCLKPIPRPNHDLRLANVCALAKGTLPKQTNFTSALVGE